MKNKPTTLIKVIRVISIAWIAWLLFAVVVWAGTGVWLMHSPLTEGGQATLAVALTCLTAVAGFSLVFLALL